MTFNCTTPEDVLQERSWPFAILCTVLMATSTLLLVHVGPRVVSSIAIGGAAGWGVWWTLGGPRDIPCDAVAWITSSVALVATCLTLCFTKLATFLLAASGAGALLFHIIPLFPIPQEPSIRGLAIYPTASIVLSGLLGGSLTCACRKTAGSVITLIAGSAGVVLAVRLLTHIPWYGLLGIMAGTAVLGVLLRKHPWKWQRHAQV